MVRAEGAKEHRHSMNPSGRMFEYGCTMVGVAMSAQEPNGKSRRKEVRGTERSEVDGTDCYIYGCAKRVECLLNGRI